jgi:Fe-S cluster biogenesis protein NfuA
VTRFATLAAALGALAILLPGKATAASPVQWCGSAAAAADRAPDATTGRQVHVVYAIPADGADRTLEVAPVIASDLADVDTWWRREDATRTPRFDTFAFPGCTSRMGSLDISTVRLPQAGSFYAAEDTRFVRVREGLLAMQFANRNKKYLVYYDGPSAEPVRVCGQGVGTLTSGGDVGSYAMVFFQTPSGCRDRLQPEQRFALTAGHELLHVLGALPVPGPPHPCPGDEGHPCDSALDILSPEASSDIFDLRLDVGRDDYYAHPGSWADVQDSAWLLRLDAAPVPLGVGVAGRGTVAADLPGLADCTGACTTEWDNGTVVTLSATPAAGSVFRGWSGACAGSGTCRVTLDAARSVTATFAVPVRLTVAAAGPGSVAGGGIACPGTCTTELDAGASVTLTATPARGAFFAGWSGACSGAAATCTIGLSEATSVQARFEVLRHRLTVAVSGRGSVTGAGTYADGTRVTVRAKAARGWRFSRWAGACRGSRGCTVTLESDRRVQAVFVRVKKR